MNICEKCGRKSRRGEHFCSRCGTPLQGVAERKHVSILFADLCGSTQRIAANDPEEARSNLDPALRLMSEAVLSFGGTVSQVRGDEVLAYFGAPVAQEDHALRACLAALAIHERAQARSREGERGYVFRVGIDSGEVIVGGVGGFLPSHYRADGFTLHRAKRLEEMAAPGTTLVSSATQRLCEGQVDVTDRGECVLRGLDKPVGVWELRGGMQRSALAPLAQRRQLAPMTGRELVLASIEAHSATAREGRMRFVGICGEAGIGKSRVAIEAVQRLARAGLACAWVTAYPYARRVRYDLVDGPHRTIDVPYSTIGDLARALLEIPGDLELEAQRVASLTAIAEAGDRLAPHSAALVDLLGLGDAGDAWLALTPAQRRRRLGDALHSLFETRLKRGPMLLVIDDIHCADTESQRMLENLAKRLEQSPLLVCATSRQEFTQRWSDNPWFFEHRIGQLADDDMQRMTAAIVGRDPTVRELSDLLVERADGNPFFLEQLAMSLVDEGRLIGTPGAYRCTCDVAGIRPSASVSATIGARVDRLSKSAKTMLECAAVLGEPITSARIARMAGVPEAEADASLRLAGSAGLLMAASDVSERFVFRHALVQEVVASTLAHAHRKRLHHKAFDALRRDSEAADDAVLLQHAYAAEAWPEAAQCALSAMSRAIARSANRDALAFFGLGLDAAGRPGLDTATTWPLALALRMEALGAQLPMGKMDDAVTNLEQAHAITRELGDLRRESGVSLQLAVILWTLGEYERGLAAASEAEASAVRCAGRSALMAARQARMMLHHAQGRYRETVVEARSVLREFTVELRARRLLPRWAVMAIVNAQAFAADACAALGDFGAAQAACDIAYAELAVGDHAFSRILLDFVQGNVWLLQGRPAAAVEVLEKANADCRRHDVPTMEPPVVARLCMAMARAGQVGPALTLIENAILEKLERLGGRYNAYYFPASHACVLFEAGRCEEALANARKAIFEARRFGQRGHEAEGTMLAADIAARSGLVAVARQYYEQAGALAAACGMELLQAQAMQRLREPIETVQSEGVAPTRLAGRE